MLSKEYFLYAITSLFVIFSLLCFGGCQKPKDDSLPPSQIEQVVNRNKVDVAKFDAVVRAASKVKASANVGMNIEQFGQYIQEYATEVEIIKNKLVSDKEKEILNYYSNALEIYNDSKLVWNYKNNDPVGADLRRAGVDTGKIWLNPGGQVLNELTGIVQKHKIEVNGNDQVGYTISDSSIQQLWRDASKLTDMANTSLQQSTK